MDSVFKHRVTADSQEPLDFLSDLALLNKDELWNFSVHNVQLCGK